MAPFFYGWIIAAAAGLGIACGVSVFIPATLGLIAGPLIREFGWSPQAIFLCPLWAAVTTVFVATPVGALVDRFGVRRTMAFGFLAEACIAASFQWLEGGIVWLYLRYAAFALLGTTTTAVAFARLVGAWFDKRRGTALGIALAGTGLGGAAWSLVMQLLIDQHGWRDAFLWVALIMVAVLAVLLLVVRETPQSIGLVVDGDREAPSRDASLREGLTLSQAMRTPVYWLMVAAFLLAVSAVYTVMLHLVPMLKSRGVAPQAAAWMQASLWMAVVFGRMVTGWLMDRFFAPHVAVGFLLPSVLGMALLAAGSTGNEALVAAMLVGVTAGAEIDVVAYCCARYFGLRHYGRIYGSLFSVVAVATAGGPALAAQLLPLMGGYGGVLWFEVLLLGLAVVLFLRFPRFEAAPLRVSLRESAAV